jgi:hypothetical protein
MPASASRSVYRMARYYTPRSEWWIRPARETARQPHSAISRASSARSVRSDRDACQPTTKREQASTTKATYTQPRCVFT